MLVSSYSPPWPGVLPNGWGEELPALAKAGNTPPETGRHNKGVKMRQVY